MKIKKILLHFWFIFTLSGCGFKEIVVRNLDTAIEHKIRKELNLNYTQQKLLSHDVDIKLNELAKPTEKYLAPLLKNFKIDQLQKLDQEKYFGDINALFLKISEDAAVLLAKYTAMLTLKQSKGFFEKYEEENKEIHKRIKNYNTDLIIQRFEFFMGNLNARQIKIIKDFKPHFISRNEVRLKYRLELQAHLIDIFNQKIPDNKRYDAFLIAYRKYNQAQRKYFESEENIKMYKMAMAVIHQCDEEQSKRIQAKIEVAVDWVDYFIKHQF